MLSTNSASFLSNSDLREDSLLSRLELLSLRSASILFFTCESSFLCLFSYSLSLRLLTSCLAWASFISLCVLFSASVVYSSFSWVSWSLFLRLLFSFSCLLIVSLNFSLISWRYLLTSPIWLFYLFIISSTLLCYWLSFSYNIAFSFSQFLRPSMSYLSFSPISLFNSCILCYSFLRLFSSSPCLAVNSRSICFYSCCLAAIVWLRLSVSTDIFEVSSMILRSLSILTYCSSLLSWSFWSLRVLMVFCMSYSLST